MKPVRIRDIGSVITGHTPPTTEKDYYGGTMLFIKPTDMVSGQRYTFETEEYFSEKACKKYKTSLLPKGAICVVCIGTLGNKLTITHCEAFTNQSVNSIVPNSHFNSDYVYYLMKYNLPKVKNLNTGTASGREFVSKSLFEKLTIDVHQDLATQQKIASILSAYDSQIENNQKRIKLLEQMAENLYKEWFVRFRFPGYETAEFEGGVPKGWKVVKVKECADRLKFGTLYGKADVETEGDVIVIDQSQEPYIGFHNNTPSHIADVDNPLILFGDHSCKFELMIVPFSLSENVVPFRAKSGIDTTYLYFTTHNLIQTTEYKRHWTEFVNKKIFLPSFRLQQEFERRVKVTLSMKQQLTVENRILTTQRDLLLPRLMSGKLSI